MKNLLKKYLKTKNAIKDAKELLDLSKLENDSQIIELAHKIVDEKKSVREVEMLAQDSSVPHKVKIVRRKTTLPEYKYVEELLHDKLDTKVKIKEKKIEIAFTNNADLNRILEILQVKE